MADATYTPKVYHGNGGDTVVVASGGAVTVESGGSIDAQSGGNFTLAAGAKMKVTAGGYITPSSGTVASTIAAVSTASGTFTAAERVKFNSVLTALKGVGILATS